MILIIIGGTVFYFIQDAEKKKEEQRFSELPTYEEVCNNTICGGLEWSRETGWVKIEGGGVTKPSDLVGRSDIFGSEYTFDGEIIE